MYEILQLYNSKTLWAEWIRLSAARAVTDIRDFVEKSTNTTTTGFDESFLAGFVETAEEVVEKKNEILSGLRATDAGLQHVSPRENERDTIVEKQARGTELIGKLIDILAEELMRVNRMKSKWAQLRVLALDKKAKKFAILQSSLVPSTATATSTATTTILRKEEKL